MAVTGSDTLVARAADVWGTAVRLADAADAVAGRMPCIVLEPVDAAQLAAMLQWSDAEGLAIVPRGAGTKLDWTPPPQRVDGVLSTARLNAPVEHCAGDLTATIPAGASIAAVNQLLAREGQWLPLDPVHAEHATIGGIVAANDSGPRRQRYGTPRDLIIGVEVALTSGRVARAGGRVVKNVAGYDLSRLLCGSFGTLGVITRATFKLAPIPATSRTVVSSPGDVRQLSEAALALVSGPLTPTAIELETPPLRLLVRFETTLRAAEEQAMRALELCRRYDEGAAIVDAASEADLWQRHSSGIFQAHQTVVKVSVLPARVGVLFEQVGAALGTNKIEWRAAGRAALGVMFIALCGSPGQHAAAVDELRKAAAGLGGTAVGLSTSAEGTSLASWVGAGDALPLMRAVKSRFDPHGTLPSLGV